MQVYETSGYLYRGAAEMHLVHYNAKYSPDEASTAPDGLAVVGIILEVSSTKAVGFFKFYFIRRQLSTKY